MRIVVFSENPILAIETRSAIDEVKWTQELVQDMDELRKALKQPISAVLTTLPPPKSTVAAFADEVFRLAPLAKLYLYVLEEEAKFQQLQESSGRVDMIFIITKGEPKIKGEGKLRFCRDMRFGEMLVAEIKSSLAPKKENTASATIPEEVKAGPASTEEARPPQAKKRLARQEGAALLRDTCPYPHRDETAAKATLPRETSQKQLFVDKNPRCSRAIQRCPKCSATNRAYARYCRACGASLDFSNLEAGLYDTLSITERVLSSPAKNIDLALGFGIKALSRMLAANGFLWLGGASNDGVPVLAVTCLGETFRLPYRIRTEFKSDTILGLESIDLQGRPALLITTRGGVHTMTLLPTPELKENIAVPGPGCEFHHPAVMLSGSIVTLEHSSATNTFHFRANSVRKELGPEASELVSIDSDRVIVCTSSQLWCYHAQTDELRPTDSRYFIDVLQRPLYRAREKQLYLSTDRGICMVNTAEPRWWLDLRVKAAPPFSFCLNRNGNLIWIHGTESISAYSTSSDAHQHFDSQSLHLSLETAGIEPVERGGMLFITSRTGMSVRHQVGLINPRRKGDYIRGEQFDRVVLPPQFNMGSSFLAVNAGGKHYLREYPLI